ncbi:MAG: CPBP family intramembrane metalloprotease [Leptospiraceae bacterium]|nr:CPBP family intramembrane metalloprotease [Leptospiraceae bacterium]MCK6380331.1 CPBP family intramembrane metalloprotease [Leptospiraceae bacterium]NUM41754.1 CPBP family intramembrane metalloprotease [Leptospiraceae bacterium]
MKHFALILFLFCYPVFSQSSSNDPNIVQPKNENQNNKEAQPIIKENDSIAIKPKKPPNPHFVALLGIVPGLGQAYIGNTWSGVFQFGLFYTLSGLEYHFSKQPDYIEYNEREVKFEIGRTLAAEEFQRNNLLYRSIPAFTESRYQRDLRLYEERKLYEINPLLKYGEYQRTSRSTFYSDTLNNPVLSVMLYSIYSGFRDAGGLGEFKKDEKIEALLLAPFKPVYFTNIKIFLPIAFLSAMLLTDNSSTKILAPPSLVRDGSLVGGAFITGISPAIGEEAFFRGYVNYSLMQSYGPIIGGGVSGLLFSMAHAGNQDAKEGFLGRALLGFYFAYLHYSSGYDLGPSIAMHFWWNFLMGLAQIKYYKPDPNYNKSQQEVHFMPVFYQMRF